MNTRLQVLISEALHHRICQAAHRGGLSLSAWVRQAIERHLAGDRPAGHPLDKLSALGGPTGNIEQTLAEIESGRR